MNHDFNVNVNLLRDGDYYSVLLLDNETREEKWIPVEHAWGEGVRSDWAYGNFSCDCNRYIFFYGMDGNDDADIQCGNSRFTLVAFRREDP